MAPKSDLLELKSKSFLVVGGFFLMGILVATSYAKSVKTCERMFQIAPN